MRKVIATMSVVTVAVLLSSALQANFTVFDLAKDSMYIARGEFTGLERTIGGDRLTLRCDEIVKGDLKVGTEVTLEAFEPAPADEALGREVIVCFNQINGKHLFLYHPFAQRSFIFESDDAATDGLDQNEQAIRNFMAINEPHQAVIISELQKRLEMEDSAYEGKYDEALINEWKAELMRQVAHAGTRAAKDAAKALVEHDLFKGVVTVEELQRVGELVPQSAVGSLERSYMLELIRNEVSAHPDLATQVSMLREETSQACVGKLSNLMNQVDNREMVLAEVGAMAGDQSLVPHSRENALHMLQALKDTDGLPFVHAALEAELNNGDTNKDVLRRAFSAMRSTPDATNAEAITAALENEAVSGSWELRQRAWLAYACVDSEDTNIEIRVQFSGAETTGVRNFFKKLLPENKIIRKLMVIHKED